jgi:hypothetical protein
MCTRVVRSVALDGLVLLLGLALATPFLLILAAPFVIRM